MKANPRVHPSTLPFRNFAVIGALAVLAACVPAPREPAPTPRPAPTPTATAPAPAPAPAPANWRDAPITPGDWSWAMQPNSKATFGAGQFTMTCNGPAVILFRQGTPGTGTVPVTITTMAGVRVLQGSSTAGGVTVNIPARDSVLDAMAFSRGRFAVSVPGQQTLYLPSWTEVSRVIEDCR